MKVLGIPLGGRLGVGQFALIDETDEDRVEITGVRWTAVCVRPSTPDRLYVQRRNTHGVIVYLHREILRPPDGLTVDHRNRNGLDNRRLNLRLATVGQNNANKATRLGGSGLKGVTRRGGRGRCWAAQIARGDGKGQRFLGLFDTPEEAADAYDAAAIERWGEFAVTNARLRSEPPIPRPVIDRILPAAPYQTGI